jgi:hypothetical protein
MLAQTWRIQAKGQAKMDSANIIMMRNQGRAGEHKRMSAREIATISTPKGDILDEVHKFPEKEKAALSIVKVQVGPES